MKYEVIIEERKKIQKFYKEAIAEYQKRLGRYCKIDCHFVKKEKEMERLFQREDGRERLILLPGEAVMSSENFSGRIGRWENVGARGIAFFIPAPSPCEVLFSGKEPAGKPDKSDRLQKETGIPWAWQDKGEILSLSDFTMPPAMTGMILCEQIYRGYRILHNHPYHK